MLKRLRASTMHSLLCSLNSQMFSLPFALNLCACVNFRSLCFQCVLVVFPIVVAKVRLFISFYSEFMNFKICCCHCCFWCAQRTILLFFFVVHLWASNLLMLGTFMNFGTKVHPKNLDNQS